MNKPTQCPKCGSPLVPDADGDETYFEFKCGSETDEHDSSQLYFQSTKCVRGEYNAQIQRLRSLVEEAFIEGCYYEDKYPSRDRVELWEGSTSKRKLDQP